MKLHCASGFGTCRSGVAMAMGAVFMAYLAFQGEAFLSLAVVKPPGATRRVVRAAEFGRAQPLEGGWRLRYTTVTLIVSSTVCAVFSLPAVLCGVDSSSLACVQTLFVLSLGRGFVDCLPCCSKCKMCKRCSSHLLSINPELTASRAWPCVKTTSSTTMAPASNVVSGLQPSSP